MWNEKLPNGSDPEEADFDDLGWCDSLLQTAEDLGVDLRDFDPTMYYDWPDWSGDSEDVISLVSRSRANRSRDGRRVSSKRTTAAEQSVEELAGQAIAACLALSQQSTSVDEVAAQAAQIALKRVRDAMYPPKEIHVVDGPVFSLGRRVDDVLAQVRRRLLGSRPDIPRTVSVVWTYVGLILSALIGLVIADPRGSTVLPLLLLATRQVLTAGLGGEGTLPFEGPTKDTSSDGIFRCWATHFSDILVLGGFLGLGLTSSDPLLVWLAAAAVAASMLGVVARTSAVQVGIQVNRLHLERLMRPWPPILLGGLATIIGGNVVQLMCIGLALGPIAYGAGEVLRTAIRIASELRGKVGRSVTLSSEDILDDGSITFASRTRAIEISGSEGAPRAA